jgi:3-hydroxyisobutyrate dehydrogenase-like beta-hydroxyacid dehydrogenase
VSETVAFIGLGRMGRLIARNITNAGHQVVVYNRTTGPAEEFVGAVGGSRASTPAEAASKAELIFTMVADGDALIDIFTGESGVLRTVRAGAVAVDMGTSGPVAVAEVRGRLEEAGARLVDAPVSGSVPAADAARLLIMVGAHPEDYERVRPVLMTTGEPLLVGPPGAGAALKLAVNSILYGLNQALAEAVALAESSGVEAPTTLDVVARSAAGAPLVSYRRPQYLDPDQAPVLFTLDLALKDLRLTLEHAAARGVSMPQGQRTMDLVAELVAGGEGHRDMGFVVEAARRRRPT